MKQYSFINESIVADTLGKTAKYISQNPKATGAIAGGGVGAVGGALTGLKKDKNGKRHVLRNAAIGAGVGTAVGVGAGHLADKKGWNKSLAQKVTDIQGKVESNELKKKMLKNTKDIAEKAKSGQQLDFLDQMRLQTAQSIGK